MRDNGALENGAHLNVHLTLELFPWSHSSCQACSCVCPTALKLLWSPLA